jgi:hypothetical protein
MSSTSEPTTSHRTYGNWQQPQSPGILGLGTIGTGLLFLTPLAAVLALMVAGMLAALITALLGAVTLLVLRRHSGKRSIGELLMVSLRFWGARARRETQYHAGMLAEVHGSHQLPGILASSELVSTVDGFGSSAGIVVLPRTAHYTAVLRLEPEGANLVDRPQIDQWVAGYGHWLSRLAHEPDLIAASVTIETAPDPGTRLAASVNTQRSADAPALAAEVLDTIVRDYPSGSAQVNAWATVTYRGTAARGRRGREQMINHVATRLPEITSLLGGTGAGAVRPMTAQEITEQVKVAYDPAIATDLEQIRDAGNSTGLAWSQAGPKAAVASWDSYRHDSGISRVWGMEKAPRGTVISRVLEQLVQPHPAIPRKRVTLVYRPHTPGEAARIVDRDVRTATTGQNPYRAVAREQSAIRAIEQSAREEAEGAGITRFSLLVSVTAHSAEELEEITAIMDGLQGTARLELRPMFGGQAAAFAATLPVGVILPEHASLPASVREAL